MSIDSPGLPVTFKEVFKHLSLKTPSPVQMQVSARLRVYCYMFMTCSMWSGILDLQLWCTSIIPHNITSISYNYHTHKNISISSKYISSPYIYIGLALYSQWSERFRISANRFRKNSRIFSTSYSSSTSP